MVCVIAIEVCFGTGCSVDDESAEFTGDKGREADLSLRRVVRSKGKRKRLSDTEPSLPSCPTAVSQVVVGSEGEPLTCPTESCT